MAERARAKRFVARLPSRGKEASCAASCPRATCTATARGSAILCRHHWRASLGFGRRLELQKSSWAAHTLVVIRTQYTYIVYITGRARRLLLAPPPVPNHPPQCLATKASSASASRARVLTVVAVEHNIPTTEEKPAHPPRRPDLSTFFSTLELVDTSDAQQHHNVHAQPQPENVAAVHRVLANAFAMMRGRVPDEGGNASEGGDGDDLLASMIEVLQHNADNPPAELAGVPNSFLDELDRVPKKTLKPTDTCPICRNPFLDGKCRGI